MLKVKTGLWIGELMIVGSLIAGLAGPALAGNVWSWETDDGTYAFTDDPKRIPARHKAEATKRPMGKLTRYERFTKVSSPSDKPYAERIHERRAELRQVAMNAPMGAIIGAAQPQDAGSVFTLPVTGGRYQGRGASGVSYVVPATGIQADADPGPTSIEDIRVKPSKSLATRHITVVKQGDRIVTVIKDELNQRSLRVRPESDFDR